MKIKLFGERSVASRWPNSAVRFKGDKLYKKAGMTWAQFCATCGISVKHADRQINVFNDLDAGLLDTVSYFGLSYRDLEEMRKLPPGLRPYVKDDAVVVPCEEGEQRIPVGSEHRAELQLAVDRLTQKVAAEQKAREKLERDNNLKVKGLERQISEMADKLETLRADAKEQVPEQAEELLEKASRGIFNALEDLQAIDLDALVGSPVAVAEAWKLTELSRGVLARLEIALGELMERIDAEAD